MKDDESTVCVNSSTMHAITASAYTTVATVWVVSVTVKDALATFWTVEAFARLIAATMWFMKAYSYTFPRGRVFESRNHGKCKNSNSIKKQERKDE